MNIMFHEFPTKSSQQIKHLNVADRFKGGSGSMTLLDLGPPLAS